MKTYVIAGGNSEIALNSILQLQAQSSDDLRIIAYTRSQPRTELSQVETHEWDAEDEFPGIPDDVDSVDGFLYAPGTINLKPFKSLSAETFMKDMQINCFAAIPALQHVLPLMRDGGDVLFYSSIAAQTGMAYHSSIAAAKAAVEGLIRSLSAEYAGTNIRFNAIALSLTDTPLAAKFISSEKKLQAMEERHPLKQIGNPEQVGRMSAAILEGEYSWMTGQVLHLDGGMSVIR